MYLLVQTFLPCGNIGLVLTSVRTTYFSCWTFLNCIPKQEFKFWSISWSSFSKTKIWGDLLLRTRYFSHIRVQTNAAEVTQVSSIAIYFHQLPSGIVRFGICHIFGVSFINHLDLCLYFYRLWFQGSSITKRPYSKWICWSMLWWSRKTYGFWIHWHDPRISLFFFQQNLYIFRKSSIIFYHNIYKLEIMMK